MLKRLSVMFVLILFGTLVLTGCSSSSGDVYLGKWIEIKKQTIGGDIVRKVEITKNGESFLIKEALTFSNQNMIKPDMSATLSKEGLLKISENDTITYVKADDTLLFGKSTLKRDK